MAHRIDQAGSRFGLGDHLAVDATVLVGLSGARRSLCDKRFLTLETQSGIPSRTNFPSSPMNQTSTDSLQPDRAACRIYLVRHGRTVMNVQVRFRGRRDI